MLDYLAGQATPLQKKAIEEWLKDSLNHEQYYQWLHDWELSHLQARASWQQAFDRTQRQVGQAMPEVTPFRTISKSSRWWNQYPYQMIAAIFLLTLLGISLYGTRDFIFYKTVKTSYSETRLLTLEDGSQVTLNANSSLRFPRFGFGKGTRLVELSGEADFQIQHLPHHQRFLVVTPTGLHVTVLGTQFTVFARPRRSQVTLRTGKVALQMSQTPKSPAIIMKPGDLVEVNPTGTLKKSHTRTPEHYASWKIHQITLDRTSLREIAAILEESYGFQVELKDPELANRTATGLLPAQNADVALELIADLFDINFTHHENKIIFKD